MLSAYIHYFYHNVPRKIVLRFFKPPIFNVILFFLMNIGILSTLPAYCQIDDSYAKNNSGLRLGAGGGITQLATHYNQNPAIGCFIGTLDYEFNRYFSAGIEGQIGTLQGVDNNSSSGLYFHSSTNDYKSINFNLKFGLGLISDFTAENKFQDAVKRLYIGFGAGVMKSNIAFTYNNSITEVYYDVKPYGYVGIVPLNVGTFIDIGNILGYDKIEINPNVQFTYIASPYPDGFKSSADSQLMGFYTLLSLTAKLKF